MVHEPARAIPVFRDCDVLVVGGGPSGTAAAVAAARTGADVVLLERYNHLGGLSTGGLVIWIDRMTDWSGTQVIRGIASDLLDRLPKDAIAGPPRGLWGSADAATAAYWKERTAAYHGIVTWSPTIDPERLKLASQELVLESGVQLLLHGLGAAPILEDGAVAGVVFESKEGRLAIRARVTVDCTGDGDIFGRAGAGADTDIEERDIHHCMNTAWIWAGCDMTRWIAFKTGDAAGFAAFMDRGRSLCGGLFERPVRVLAQRRRAVHGAAAVGLFRDRHPGPDRGRGPLAPADGAAPGRVSRARAGVRERVPDAVGAAARRAAFAAAARRGAGDARAMERRRRRSTDEIGVSPSLSPKLPPVSVPYGCLVPRSLDGLLVGGAACVVRRGEPFVPARDSAVLADRPGGRRRGRRGGAAGVPPRAVPVAQVQAELLRQGAFVRMPAEATA